MPAITIKPNTYMETHNHKSNPALFIFSHINPLDNCKPEDIIHYIEIEGVYHFNMRDTEGRPTVRKCKVSQFLTTQIEQFQISRM